MAVLFSLARSVRGPLSVNIPQASVPVGITQLFCTVNRFSWPAGDNVASAKVEFSFDNGVTWPLGGEVILPGGQISYKGNPDAPSGVGYTFPSPTVAGTLVRGQVTLNAALDCSVVVEAV